MSGIQHRRDNNNTPLFANRYILDPNYVRTGGLSRVQRAEDRELNGRVVALKTLKKSVDGDGIKRFYQEAEAVSKLDHPAIVKVYDFDRNNIPPYITMEFLPNGTLEELLQRRSADFHEAAQLIATIADAVECANVNGIIHRDIKPGNILLDSTNRPKLADFGAAHLFTDDTALTTEIARIGTPKFMSPEQASGHSKHVTPATDVYGLGATFYVMLTDRPPFPNDPEREFRLEMVIHTDPVPPRRIKKSVPKDLQTICMKCLEKRQDRRYSSAYEFADDVRRYLKHQCILATPPSILERVIKQAERHPSATLAASAFAALFVLSVLGLLILNFQHSRELSRETTAKSIALDAEKKARQESQEFAEQRNAAANESKENATKIRRLLYISQMRECQTAMDRGDFDRALELINAQWPTPDDEEDLRDIEWYLLWDEIQSDFNIARGHPGFLIDAVFSPNGEWIATTSIFAPTTIWDTKSGQRLRVLPTRASFSAFSRVGVLATANGLDVDLWDTETWAHIATLPQSHSSPVDCLSFSPDGSTLVSGSADKTLILWDVRERKIIHVLVGHSGGVRGVDFAPDGTKLVSSDSDGIIRVWNIDTAECTHSIKAHNQRAVSVSFSADGKYLASAGWDGTAKVWSTNDWSLTATLRGHTNGILRSVDFSPDSSLLATAGRDKTVRIWRASDWSEAHSYRQHRAMVWSATFSPSGKLVASVSASPIENDDGTMRDGGAAVRLWNPLDGRDIGLAHDTSGMLRYETKLFTDSVIKSLALTRPGGPVITGNDQGIVHVWERTGELQTVEAHTGIVWRTTYLHGRDAFATAGEDGGVLLWNLSTGELVRKFAGHRGIVTSLVRLGDGQHLISGGHDQMVRVWNLDSGEETRTFSTPTAVQCVAVSPTTDTIAIGTDDGNIVLIDQDDFSEKGRLKASDASLRVLHFSNDGAQLVTYSNLESSAIIWNVALQQRVHELRGHYAPIECVNFSASGKRVITTSQDRTVRIWDSSSGSQIMRRDMAGSGHADIACGNENREIGIVIWTAGFLESTVHIWKIASQDQLVLDLKTLNSQDPDNMTWQRWLALACWNAARQSMQSPTRALGFLHEGRNILARLSASGQLSDSEKTWISKFDTEINRVTSESE